VPGRKDKLEDVYGGQDVRVSEVLVPPTPEAQDALSQALNAASLEETANAVHALRETSGVIVRPIQLVPTACRQWVGHQRRAPRSRRRTTARRSRSPGREPDEPHHPVARHGGRVSVPGGRP
jgi:hypothetical protein